MPEVVRYNITVATPRPVRYITKLISAKGKIIAMTSQGRRKLYV